jgi:hypothetical protein
MVKDRLLCTRGRWENTVLTPPEPDQKPAVDPSAHLARPGAVTTAGHLLLVQAACYVALGAIQLTLHMRPAYLRPDRWFSGDWQRLAIASMCIPLALLMLLAAVGLYRLARQSWLLACFCQSVGLVIGLLLYRATKPWYAYVLMAWGIAMVLVLNYRDARAPFRPPPVTTGEWEADEW